MEKELLGIEDIYEALGFPANSGRVMSPEKFLSDLQSKGLHVSYILGAKEPRVRRSDLKEWVKEQVISEQAGFLR